MPCSRASSRSCTTVSVSRLPAAGAAAAGLAAGLLVGFAAGLVAGFAVGLVAGFAAEVFAAGFAVGFFADPALADGTFTDVTPPDDGDFADLADFGFFVPDLDDVALACATTDSNFASISAARFFAALSTLFARRFASATASRALSSAFAAAFSAFVFPMVFPSSSTMPDDRC